MMENEDFIVTDDEVKFISQEQTVGELDHLTLEDGGQIIIEEATFTDIATNQSATVGQPHFDAYGFHNASIANEIGEITSIEMINKGNGFIKLPLVLDSATTTGSGASLFAVSNVTPMVGNVEGIEVTNFGLDYTSNPTLTLNRNVLVRNVSGSFTVGDALVSHTGTVVSFDSSRNILQLKTSVTLNEGDVITTSTGATATVHQSTPSFANATVGTVGTTVGNFVGDSGKVSVDTMRVQDSFYYQDYSYVVRIGQSINEWRESVRRSVHPLRLECLW